MAMELEMNVILAMTCENIFSIFSILIIIRTHGYHLIS